MKGRSIMWVWVVFVSMLAAGLRSIHVSFCPRRDLGAGRPSYMSLVGYTGISNPEGVSERFGEGDGQGRFGFCEKDLAHPPRPWWMLFIDDLKTDVAMIAASVAGGLLSHLDK